MRYVTPLGSVGLIVTGDVKEQYNSTSINNILIEGHHASPCVFDFNSAVCVSKKHVCYSIIVLRSVFLFAPVYNSLKTLSSVSDTTTVFCCFPPWPLHLHTIYWVEPFADT